MRTLCKVGDTLTANVTPAKATNVSYAWYTGDSATALNTQIAGATSATYTVTKDDLGKFVGVVVKGDKDSTATAVSAVAVAEADSTQIAITAAKQTGAKSIEITTSGKITSSDKVTVKKGATEVKIDGALTYTDNGATFSLVDKITATEYEVTLTPADTKVAATSVKFTGETSQLKEIKFLNNYLVMKDHKYDEGYCYVKGYDQFGGEVNLSGLTATPGVGEFKSYDNATGKITITKTAAGAAQPFLLVKEVPMFVQYQQGNNVLTANQLLTVSNRAYVDTLEFEDEIGKDGTKRSDGKLTLQELGSGKYYVAFKSIKDQYGNDLSADDLEAQRTDANGATLFVIPSDNGAFFTTGKFGTLNGKTILWLTAPADAKPGTMALTITGAGGKTFSKDVTIDDNPYIDALSVAYPELYSGAGKSNTLEFSAVDQYGDTVDLWDFRPYINAAADTLTFRDINGMTNQQTEIKVSGGVHFNDVLTNASTKTFTVTLDCNHANGVAPTAASAVAAKTMAVFTATTAGMKVNTHSVTVGELGGAAKVKTALASGAPTQLVAASRGKDDSINFNKYVQFEDSNGNTMVRGKSEKYPTFLSTIATPATNIADPAAGDTAKDYTGGFFWTLSSDKVKAGTAANFDNDGVVHHGDFSSASADYHVTVYGNKGGAVYYILDEQDFHLTRVTGAESEKYEIVADGKIYAVPGSGDTAEIKVSTTTKAGEKYDVAKSRVRVVGNGNFAGSDGTCLVTENLSTEYPENTEGKATVTVYVDGKEAGTVDVEYGNTRPVAKTAKFEYVTKAGGASLVGASFDNDVVGDEFTAANTASIDITNGVMTITDANDLEDKFIAKIEDQYGQTMTDTKFYYNGKEFATIGALNGGVGDRFAIQYTNGSVSKKFYETFDGTTAVNVVAPSVKWQVSNATELTTALNRAKNDDNANTITVAATIADYEGNLEIPKNDTLVIENGCTLTVTASSTTAAEAITVKGTLENDGTLNANGTAGMGDSSKVDLKLDGGTLTNAGTIAFAGTATGTYTFGTNKATINLASTTDTDNGDILQTIFTIAPAAGSEINLVKDTKESTGNTKAINANWTINVKNGATWSLVASDVITSAGTAKVNVEKGATFAITGAGSFTATNMAVKIYGTLDVVNGTLVCAKANTTLYDDATVKATAADAIITATNFAIDNNATTGITFKDTTANTSAIVTYASAAPVSPTPDYTAGTPIVNTTTGAPTSGQGAEATIAVATGKIKLTLA